MRMDRLFVVGAILSVRVAAVLASMVLMHARGIGAEG